jgi:hypothetical protein
VYLSVRFGGRASTSPDSGHAPVAWRELRAGYSGGTRIASGRSAPAVETERQVHQILAAGLHGTLNLELRRAAERQAG